MNRPTPGREIVGLIVHRQMLVPTADNMGGQQLAADVIDKALAEKDAEIERLRGLLGKIAYVSRKASLTDSERIDDVRGLTADFAPGARPSPNCSTEEK